MSDFFKSFKKEIAISPLPPQIHAPYSGFIIVKLKPEYQYFEQDNFFDFLKDSQGNSLSSLIKNTKPCFVGRLINNISIQELKALESVAQKSKFPPIRSLLLYWRLDYRNTKEKLDTIVSKLKTISFIDFAYKEFIAYDCSIDYSDEQSYLLPSMDGLNVKWAWEKGYKGKNVGFIDLEQGWKFSHQELSDIITCNSIIVNHNGAGVSSLNEDGREGVYSGYHGTSVLGIVFGKNDNKGINGIAPDVEYVRLASHYNRVVNASGRIVEAIIGVINKIFCKNGVRGGDILLLEVQKNNLPVESEIAVFDAIRLASALGLIVIEAAGNGAQNIDSLITHVNLSEDFDSQNTNQTSGAILVGGAKPVLDNQGLIDYYKKDDNSNYGYKVVCFAPVKRMQDQSSGESLFKAPGVNESNEITINSDGLENSYRGFGGTSLASAIVAGAAILVQCAYKDINNSYLSPSQMRWLLSSFGIKAYNRYATQSNGCVLEEQVGLDRENSQYDIGRMPNLQEIIRCGLKNMPDIYIRSDYEDNGKMPFLNGDIDNSPDILVLEPSSQGRYDNPFILIDNEGLESPNIIKVGSNSIYIRFYNRSVFLINEEITADIYLSKPTSYFPILTLGAWELITNSHSINIYNEANSQNYFTWSINNGELNIGEEYYLMVIIRQEKCDSLSFPSYEENQNSMNNFQEMLASKQIFNQFVRKNNNVALLKLSYDA